MKKYIGILFACILFTGCSAEKSVENKPLYSIAENGVEKTQAPQGCRLVTEPEEFMAVTEKSGEDMTSGNNNHMLVDGGTVDTGSRIYSIMNTRVFFYDKKTGAEDILCSKPDCGHISTDCPANVSEGGNGLAYYNGALYTVNPYDLCLMRLSEDGTEYDKVLELCGTTQDEISRKIQSGDWYTWILYRGYIYYIYSYYAGSEEDTYYLNGSHCIYRMALDGKSEPECLMPVTPGSVSELVQFQTAGDYVYMSVPDTHEDKDAYGGCMYRYNIAGDQMEKLTFLGEDILGMTITGEYLYYSTQSEPERIKYYNLENDEYGELFTLTGTEYPLFSMLESDEDFLYVSYLGKTEQGEKKSGYYVCSREGVVYGDINLVKNNEYYDTLLGSDSNNYYILKCFTNKGNGYKEYGVALDYDSYSRLCYVTKEDLRNGIYQLHVVEKSPGTQTE